MFRFLRGLMSAVARGLWWMAHQAIALPIDLAGGLFTGLWRAMFPPPAAEAETGAEIAERVVEAIVGTKSAAARAAEDERPVPQPASAATVRRRMERALAYTAAVMSGDTLPSLDHVGADLAHELRRLRTPADAEPMHRELMRGLGMDADGWVRPRREILAPGPEHDHGPSLRYA